MTDDVSVEDILAVLNKNAKKPVTADPKEREVVESQIHKLLYRILLDRFCKPTSDAIETCKEKYSQLSKADQDKESLGGIVTPCSHEEYALKLCIEQHDKQQSIIMEASTHSTCEMPRRALAKCRLGTNHKYYRNEEMCLTEFNRLLLCGLTEIVSPTSPSLRSGATKGDDVGISSSKKHGSKNLLAADVKT